MLSVVRIVAGALFMEHGTQKLFGVQVRIRRAFFPIQNGGDNAVLFCFFYLYLLFAGGGDWSLDSLIAHAKPSALPEPAA